MNPEKGFDAVLIGWKGHGSNFAGINETLRHHTHQINQLGEPQTELDEHGVGVIADWPNQSIVITQ